MLLGAVCVAVDEEVEVGPDVATAWAKEIAACALPLLQAIPNTTVPAPDDVTVAVPEEGSAPCQAALPGPPLGMHTTEPGELQVRVTGELVDALGVLAERTVSGVKVT